MKMYVGNLPFQTSNDELQELFSNYGTVTDIHMPMDRDSGRPRGFAFVTMSSKDEMVAAIKALDGEDLGGRPLRVNEAQPREERGGGGYKGGGRGGNDRRGGGNGYGRNDRRGGGGGRW
ncbi:MAG: RNA recognition motif domain-containing protein [Luteolibacter sp.]